MHGVIASYIVEHDLFRFIAKSVPGFVRTRCNGSEYLGGGISEASKCT